MASWYYVDNAGKQVGPVSAEEVRAAVQLGNTGMANLGWRDGLPNWAPLSQLADELGLAAGAAATTVVMSPAGVPVASEANPYRAPEAISREGDDYVGGGDVVYAGFWRRWAALFIDQLIISIPLSAILMGVMFALGIATDTSDPFSSKRIAVQIGYYLVWFTVGFFYYAGQESSQYQATLGKRVLGIKVTDVNGRRLTFQQALIRWFCAALSYVSIYIGFAMAGFTQRKQALHDFMASTLVVDQWAYTQFPERQQRGLGGCAIAFIGLLLFGLVALVAVFAIAIAAYQSNLGH